MAKFIIKNLINAILLLSLSGCSFLGIKFGKNPDNIQKIEKKDLGGIFKSVDKGKTFTHKVKIVDKNFLNKINVKKICFDPQETLTLYMLTWQNGLWVSYNGAESWEKLLEPPIQAFALDTQRRGIIYAIKEKNIIISKDGGSSWESVFLEISEHKINTLSIDPQNSDRILATTKSGLIFESLDQGTSWKMLKKMRLQTLKDIIINPRNSQEMYLTTVSEGIFKSNDSGDTWKQINLKRFYAAEDYGQLKINPILPSHVYLASRYGLLKSVNSGKKWTPIKLLTPYGSKKILSLGFNPFNEQELYYATENLFFKSEDGGKTWTSASLPSKRLVKNILIDNFDPNIIYIGVSNY